MLVVGCSNNSAEITLKERLKRYKKCFTQKDYICMSSMVLPSIVEELGGVEAFINTMKLASNMLAKQGMTVDPSKMQFGEPSAIIMHEEFAVSVIPTKQPVSINGKKGYILGSIIAFSGDKGKTWFFLEGSDEGKIALVNEAPGLLQKINIPNPKLQIGDMVFIQKMVNGLETQLSDLYFPLI